jgi:hypothetical protein
VNVKEWIPKVCMFIIIKKYKILDKKKLQFEMEREGLGILGTKLPC